MNNHERYGDKSSKSETLERVTGMADQLDGERRRNTGLRDEIDQLRRKASQLDAILQAYEVGPAFCATLLHTVWEQETSGDVSRFTTSAKPRGWWRRRRVGLI